MIDLDTEQKTALAMIHFAMMSKGFKRYEWFDEIGEYADPIMSFYTLLGTDGERKGKDAFIWALKNVKVHRDTMSLVAELNDDIFADLTPELRRDAIVVTLNDLNTKLIVAQANRDMAEEPYYA